MGRYIADDLVEEIRLSNDIVDVVSQYVKLERKGKHMFGLCPFHREKTASFSVTESKQMYYCYSCGKGGNVINFIKDIENLDFIDAVEFLAARVGIEIPDTVSDKDVKLSSLKKEVKELNVYAGRFFYDNLLSEDGKSARKYLKDRGLLQNTIKKFGIGYSSNKWDKLYCSVKDKFSEEAIEKSGIFLRNKNGGFYDRFRNRVMFPIFDIRGEVVGFGGRTMDNSTPKYLNSPETVVYSKRKNLYAMNFAKRYSEENLIMVEGYMDAVSLHQAGVRNVAASLGTAFTEEQARLIKKYTKEVVLSYDMDSAGQNATARAIKILEDAGLQIKVLTIPKGKDPDEFIKKYGREVFCDLVKDSITAFEYRVRTLEKSIDLDSLNGRVKFLNEIAKILSSIYNSLEREVYINKIAKDYKISQESILKEIERLSNKEILNSPKLKTITSNRRKLIKKSNDVLSHYEELILILIANNNELFWSVEKDLEEIEFEDETVRELLAGVIKKIKNKERVAFGWLLSLLNDDEASRYVRIYEDECNFGNNQKAILDIIKKMRIIKLKKKQQNIVQKLSEEILSDDEESKIRLKYELEKVLEEMKILRK